MYVTTYVMYVAKTDNIDYLENYSHDTVKLKTLASGNFDQSGESA